MEVTKDMVEAAMLKGMELREKLKADGWPPEAVVMETFPHMMRGILEAALEAAD
jgi:hypothetical protein